MATAAQVVKRILVGIVALAGLFALFLWTLRDTVSTPYSMDPQLLSGWKVVALSPRDPHAPVIALTPPRELTMSLFQQVFERTMESMNAPPTHAIVLIGREEFAQVLAGFLTPEELVRLAQDAGLEAAVLDPTCLAVRVGTSPGAPGRTFYVAFSIPALRRFRESVVEQLDARGGARAAFDPAALTPRLYLAATDGGFQGWPDPGGHRAEADECVAPVTLDGS